MRLPTFKTRYQSQVFLLHKLSHCANSHKHIPARHPEEEQTDVRGGQNEVLGRRSWTCIVRWEQRGEDPVQSVYSPGNVSLHAPDG